MMTETFALSGSCDQFGLGFLKLDQLKTALYAVNSLE